ncbi:scavenger receptor class F member 1-like [Pecten maximus]|uniref:scavenger receptor class F member 1-like n=1 Tax=Pecten maximus TaxID=6579 RepID=UPI001457F739|nr:scavenger receptor class F member 1-like [Pecten maximus]
MECIPGKYNNTCEQNCSGNCKDRLCIKDTGHCSGCSGGFHGTNCSMKCNSICVKCDQQSGECTDCKAGLYGVKCNMTCGHCSSCDIDTGACVTECESDYEGEFCNTKQAQQSESPPPVDVGPIVGAIVGVIVVAVIAIVIVIIVRRRRLSAGKEESLTDIGRSNVHQNDVYSDPPETEHLSVKSEAAAENIYSNTPGDACFLLIYT